MKLNLLKVQFGAIKRGEYMLNIKIKTTKSTMSMIYAYTTPEINII